MHIFVVVFCSILSKVAYETTMSVYDSCVQYTHVRHVIVFFCYTVSYNTGIFMSPSRYSVAVFKLSQ